MAKTNKRSIKDDFTMLSILIIPIGVAVNVVGGRLASTLSLPMYLDTIGTIFTGIIAGPWVGAVTGLLTNIVTGIMNPVNFWFIHVNVIAGLVTGWLARKGWFTSWWKGLLATVIQALVSTIASAPPVVYVYGGVTGSGTSLLSAVLIASGKSIWASFFSVEIVWTIVDRIISWLISIAVIKCIPNKTLIKFPLGELYTKKKVVEEEPVEE